jgi:large subunit ribosomal protein L3
MGMTQIFDEDGNRVPVTVVQLGPCTVIRKKSEEGADGYSAVVLGFEDAQEHRLSKPVNGQFKAANAAPKKVLREFRMPQAEVDALEVGAEVTASLFEVGTLVDVVGTSKGRGFQGVMKRHNHHGAKRTHGVHEAFRHGGSIGMASYPGRVMKGTAMPGRMGNAQVKIQNVKVVSVDEEKNIVLLKGGVPGGSNGLVIVTAAGKVEARSNAA